MMVIDDHLANCLTFPFRTPKNYITHYQRIILLCFQAFKVVHLCKDIPLTSCVTIVRANTSGKTLCWNKTIAKECRQGSPCLEAPPSHLIIRTTTSTNTVVLGRHSVRIKPPGVICCLVLSTRELVLPS